MYFYLCKKKISQKHFIEYSNIKFIVEICLNIIYEQVINFIYFVSLIRCDILNK